MGARRRALLQSAPFPYGVSRIPYPGAQHVAKDEAEELKKKLEEVDDATLLRALEGRREM